MHSDSLALCAARKNRDTRHRRRAFRASLGGHARYVTLL